MSDINAYTTAEIANLTPQSGDLVLNTDDNAVQLWNGSAWKIFNSDVSPVFNEHSLNFDGVDDGLLAGSAITLSGSSAWTVSFWAKDLTGSGNSRTYSVFNSGSVAALTSNPPSSGHFGFRLQYRWSNLDGRPTVYDDGSLIAGTYSNAFNPNNWNHVAYTHDGSGTRKLYANGSLQGTLTGKTNDFLSAGNWIFGKSGTDPLNMRFDEIALIPSDLSGSMADLYNSGVAPDLGTGGLNVSPTNWWRMEDGSGSTVTDNGNAGNDAAIQNQATFSSDTPS